VVGHVFIFISFQEPFDLLSYFFYDPLSLSNVLFSLQLLSYFLLLLLLSCSFNALLSDKMQGVISIFLYLLRLALGPKILSILENVPWAAEKNVYYAIIG
jgi:hypothetical protein